MFPDYNIGSIANLNVVAALILVSIAGLLAFAIFIVANGTVSLVMESTTCPVTVNSPPLVFCADTKELTNKAISIIKMFVFI